MKTQTIQEYLNLHHQGDSARVKFVKLDYSKVRNVSGLIAWACSAFDLPQNSNRAFRKPEKCLEVLFQTLGDRKQHYIVLENSAQHKSKEVQNVLESMNGWKQALGFHLSRDYRVEVAFFQDPDTK